MVAQCDFWFPAVELPVGFGQPRGAARLPVLVMACGYSRWLSARLLPSRASIAATSASTHPAAAQPSTHCGAG
jgi:hypothetical protein